MEIKGTSLFRGIESNEEGVIASLVSHSELTIGGDALVENCKMRGSRGGAIQAAVSEVNI